MQQAGQRDGARRILIYGVTGSGKTTLARRLADASHIAWHSVDDLTWNPAWVPVPEDEQRRRIQRICQEPEWILDTAYGAWLDLPFDRAQRIVALDYPRWVSLQRLMRRTLARLFDGREVCNGNRESLRNVFSRDSIIVWHFKSFDRKRQRIRGWADNPIAPPVTRLRSPRQAEGWLDEVRTGAIRL